MGSALMIQGCSSNAGKSYLTAGLCRLYSNRGYRVAPFKAQNMSNNAGVTPDGLEMGRAQLLQAQAARVTPDVKMNPVLIKPEGNDRSQVVVLGRPDQVLSQLPWTERKRHLWGPVRDSLNTLLGAYDLVIIEGAGSPAEINLKAGDIVNMRVAKEAEAKVLLVADIDRGGAFAHLLGTWHCQDDEEKSLIRGFVLNKFRGDSSLLGEGLRWLESRTRIPVLGVVPFLELPLPDEDAFSLEPPREPAGGDQPLIAIVRTPAISNFDEFDALTNETGIRVHWARHPRDLDDAAAVILPGSKHVVADLRWLHETGIAERVRALAQQQVTILGICGGLQMLGNEVHDPEGVESQGIVPGLGLLDINTELAATKITRQVNTRWLPTEETLHGYEIHHGRTGAGPEVMALLEDGLGYQQDGVLGVYVHGLFDNEAFRVAFLERIGVKALERNWQQHVDSALDRLAEHLNTALDIDSIDRTLRGQELYASRSLSRLYLVTGGVRSGKSRYAEALAKAIGGEQVTYIATLSADDEEMRERIARHQASRPYAWLTVEAHLDLASALGETPTPVVLLDCLSGFVSNVLLNHEGDSEAHVADVIFAALDELLLKITTTARTVIVVTNEVGDGVVPPYPLGRRYRDLLGLANQRVASAADAVSRLTVGIPHTLKGTFPEVDLDA